MCHIAQCVVSYVLSCDIVFITLYPNNASFYPQPPQWWMDQMRCEVARMYVRVQVSIRRVHIMRMYVYLSIYLCFNIYIYVCVCVCVFITYSWISSYIDSWLLLIYLFVYSCTVYTIVFINSCTYFVYFILFASLSRYLLINSIYLARFTLYAIYVCMSTSR